MALPRLRGRRRTRHFWRRRALDPRRYPVGPLRDLAAAPPAAPDTPWDQVDFLAVDLETTGLDVRHDHVLSAGWVPVRGGQVVLAEAHDVTVSPPAGVTVGDSANIHQITDDAVTTAPALGVVLPDLLGALQGHVLVAHHVPVELGFLARAADQTWSGGLPVTAVDTMSLQHRIVAGQYGEVRPGNLRLDDARQHFGLPRYPAHRALTDAIGSAELLLAQAGELEHRLGRRVRLGDLSPVYLR